MADAEPEATKIAANATAAVPRTWKVRVRVTFGTVLPFPRGDQASNITEVTIRKATKRKRGEIRFEIPSPWNLVLMTSP
jgi:hypothetical protein